MKECDILLLGLILGAFLSILILVICLDNKNKELFELKAKCVKAGVATYTVDVNSGIATFVFDIGEEK